MDWVSLRCQYDPGDYYTALIEFPLHVERALKQMEGFEFSFAPKNILVCGMGGSGIPGYLLKSYARQKLSIPVDVENGYDLPAWVNKDTLIFIISYSGNTEETLSCLKQGIDKGFKMVLISSGGLLEKAALKYNLPFIKAPQSFQPRAATPYLFTYLLEVLRKIGLLFPNYDEALKELRKIDLRIDKNNNAKEFAEKLVGKYVYIYATRDLEAVGRRLQAQDFNENAKTLAKFSVVPEENHNELSAWSECQDLPLAVITLWDSKASDSIKARLEFTERVCKAKAEVIRIEAKGRDLLSRMLTLIYQGDLISYYLSLLRNKDPLPVRVVEDLKEHLKKTRFKDKIIKELGL